MRGISENVSPGGEPRRVLMTADPIGGVWTYALELVRALEPAGVTFGLATMGRALEASQRAEVAALKNVTLFESRYALEWMDEPWAEVDAAGDWLLEIEARFKPDVVHLNGYCHGTLPWGVPVLVAAHSCVCSWWEAVWRMPAPVRYGEYRERVAAGLNAAALVVAPSAAMLASAHAHYGLRVPRRVIAHGRDSRDFVAAKKQPRILAGGRVWDEARNLGLLEAVASFVEWPVDLAGECRHPDGALRKCKNVNWLGRLSPHEFAQRLANAAIYAAPARYEPFGLAILEAALSGCALVLADLPSLRENWDGAALFAPAEDEAAWCGIFKLLMADGEGRAQLAQRARQRALLLSSQAMAEGYRSAYRELLGAALFH